MVVKMMKWSPWPATATRKYKVKVKLVKLEGCFDDHDNNNNNNNCNIHEDDEDEEKVMVIRLKWKGEPMFGLVPFHRTSKQRKQFSKERVIKKSAIEWDDEEEEEFDNVCCFTIVSIGQDGHENFGPWNISFSLLYGEKKKMEMSKAKLVVIGRAWLNIAEMARKKKMMMDSGEHFQVETKLPINLQLNGVVRKANLLVLVDFVEVRDSQDSVRIVPNSVESSVQLNEEDQTAESSTFDTENAAEERSSVKEPGPAPIEPVKKMGGLFSWKRRRLSFKPTTIKAEPSGINKIDVDPQCSGSIPVDSVTSGSPHPQVEEDKGAWESKEVISRDGQTKLKTSVFFASFDQCSNKAAGESACTALVAVIAHWLQWNQNIMPTRPEFDNLILQGSSEWRKLCENDAYTNDFPNKHFDLETVLHADIRPIAISRDDSFIGFFSPEKFESLKEAMSFHEIWDGIKRVTEDFDHPRIYIVSWNDHFFLLKAETNAYYIIDSLGERLFEGCSQAYILRFDDSTLMFGKNANSSEDNNLETIICSGKECCKEYIKRFLAAIPLGELEAEERKRAVSYYSLHHRLQIELNFSYLLSSSFTSSPFSSASSCSTDDCI
ncbi:hypothetical protein ACH5RR_040093 [Cinchona calisaya]|uniref:C2 NT-type domain-containing protein n=1 Tax=Cinchona calisaya TaxID=153742 RepID=A0ABD2XRG1_9GENT